MNREPSQSMWDCKPVIGLGESHVPAFGIFTPCGMLTIWQKFKGQLLSQWNYALILRLLHLDVTFKEHWFAINYISDNWQL